MPWSRNASAGRQRRRPGRAAEEEARRKLEEAAALEKSGDVAGAEAALQDAEVSEDVSRMVFVPGGAPKAKGVSAGKDWEIVSIDGKSVPLMVSGVEIRPVDTAAVMRLIRAQQGLHPNPRHRVS